MAIVWRVARGLAAAAAVLVAALPVVASAQTASTPPVLAICVTDACAQPASVVVGDGPLTLGLRFTAGSQFASGLLTWNIPAEPPGFPPPQRLDASQPGFVMAGPASSGRCHAANPQVRGRTVSVEFVCPPSQWFQVDYGIPVVPTWSGAVTFPTLFDERAVLAWPSLLIEPAPPTPPGSSGGGVPPPRVDPRAGATGALLALGGAGALVLVLGGWLMARGHGPDRQAAQRPPVVRAVSRDGPPRVELDEPTAAITHSVRIARRAETTMLKVWEARR